MNSSVACFVPGIVFPLIQCFPAPESTYLSIVVNPAVAGVHCHPPLAMGNGCEPVNDGIFLPPHGHPGNVQKTIMTIISGSTIAIH